MTEEEKIHFLKNVIPFTSLDDSDLKVVAGTMKITSFAPKTTIIRQENSGTSFYIIHSGLVKVSLRDKGDKEKILGFLGEGDCFGEISLITRGPTTADIHAVEHTVCLEQPEHQFLQMIQKHPIFIKFFNQLLTQRMRVVYKSLIAEHCETSNIEPYLYTKQVKDMISPLDTFTDESATIKDAAGKILGKNLEATVILDRNHQAVGILGLDTIVKAVVLDGMDPAKSVKTIMKEDFCEIDGKSYFFDALHWMIKHKTHVLAVKDREKVRGILTVFDLLRFRGREVLSLIRNIEDAADLSQLNLMRQEVEKVLRALMSDGAMASQACKIVSEFNDKVVKRVIQFAEDVCGPSPCAFAWLGLGSEGRREQTLFTDQDNAIIFEDPPSDNSHEYFMRFSERIVQGLHDCGIPLCKGNVMATNPKFFGSLRQWKERTASWIRNTDLSEAELMDTYVFLDFRTIHGDQALEKELRQHINELIAKNLFFLKSLAESIISIPMPIGFFKHFIVEKTGKYKDRLNIKLYGLVPLITCIKILSLQYGLMETNTLERIEGLAKGGVISADLKEALEQTFQVLLTLKIKNNLVDIDEGKDFGNYVNPTDLSLRQKQLLKEAFWTVSELQKKTKETLKVEEQRF
ncbi:MAG: nucleotidyltransferase family protein [Deltaproteobacteria bacterium]|nr:nucleotidyltransferase family protein [Deltaproteobacteria bacterium]